ncbi:GMC oxidoreductase [Epithele typhae]|uniref:GMC oxidoreductase n=1 Tax=Epithele typhae TaxID=378194 RepID=UPI0020076C13|nr:GMC oxidoreductase [Epithele typhae]KAH9917647.1 GMC oxidoreductase [Epithele typhae]
MLCLANIDQVSGQSFDYVVIGGGTAGLVVATRLSEDTDRPCSSLKQEEALITILYSTMSLALNSDDTDLPAQQRKFFGHKEHDWGFETIPQAHAHGVIMQWPRRQILTRSDTTDPECLEEDLRGISLGSDLVTRMELGDPSAILHQSGKVDSTTSRHVHTTRAIGSSSDVRFARPNRPVVRKDTAGWNTIFAEAMASNGMHNVEIDPMSVDPHTMRRSSAARELQDYLRTAGSRPNLKVVLNARVSRMKLVDGPDGAVAEAVEFCIDGVRHEVRVKGEVVLSAGTIQSPQILELSGIGDTSVLKKCGIKTKVDLPAVGTNLQEHLMASVVHEATETRDPEKWVTHDPLRDPLVDAEQVKLLLSAVDPECAKAIVEKIPSGEGVPGLPEQYAEQLKHYKNDVPSFELLPAPSFRGRTRALCTLLPATHSASQRSILIASKKTSCSTQLRPQDALAFLAEFKIARKVLRTEPLASILSMHTHPWSSVHASHSGVIRARNQSWPNVQTDEELVEWLKKHSGTSWHATGTCSMLPRDKGGVVDPQLRVYGTKNVRVADLSIIPLTPCCHTQCVAYTIGEIGEYFHGKDASESELIRMMTAADLLKGVMLGPEARGPAGSQ